MKTKLFLLLTCIGSLTFNVLGQKSVKPEMIFVKGGTFQMGNVDGETWEKPVHSVTVNDFFIGKYEVTQKQWRDVMGNDPPSLEFRGCDQCPVERVSWNDVQQFLQKLNKKTGKNYRLPTEAEWEYAARGGNKTKGYSFSGGDTIGEVAWYQDNSLEKTHPVGQKQPNELGIFDMTGNVWEWCSDWYTKDYYKNSPYDNPKGPSSGTNKSLRGGSLDSKQSECLTTTRHRIDPNDHSFNRGFRLCSSK